MCYLKQSRGLLKKIDSLQKTFAVGLRSGCRQMAKCQEAPKELKLCFPPNECYINCNPPKPCFDMDNVHIMRAGLEHGPLITKFLYLYYWTREPISTSLYMDVKHSAYIDLMTKKYSYQGDRFIAFYYCKCLQCYAIIGVGIASKILPYHWEEADLLASWCDSEADRNGVAFRAHVLKSPNLFDGYRVSYLYNVDALCTIPEVAGFGVGGKLLDTIREEAIDLNYPITHVICTGDYMQRMCQKRQMTRVWCVSYDNVTDIYGRKIFFPRYPHMSCEIYINLYRVGL